jgi:hypothetical protein
MGGFSGVVRDASGEVARGARTAPALVPAAEHAVTVTKEGFAPWEVCCIGILVGRDLNFNVTLNMAATATPIVEQTKTGVSQVVESGQILDLPINGCRVDSWQSHVRNSCSVATPGSTPLTSASRKAGTISSTATGRARCSTRITAARKGPPSWTRGPGWRAS